MNDTHASELEAEVVAANQLLATWFGTDDADPEILERVAATQSETFTMLSIDRVPVTKSQLLDGLRQKRSSQPGLRIEITEFEVLFSQGDVRVIRCRERHHLNEERSDRWTTAVLTVQRAQPRFRWHVLHESAAG
ncbi:hypothetical protein CIB93_05230 [Streptomyces sp. WZ.A104]|uniref:hypothetical protein n=1 Tax=Streptomyces sp. WZ.A104 TaxID=2023771 RepID=UPI000BBCBD19|nr:hypothetical protein [Streptomyces sp. WZ.A104]PCG86947.1 hypothetical protein CIB93_05230 [Streptomyces sp. WZ.A104]